MRGCRGCAIAIVYDRWCLGHSRRRKDGDERRWGVGMETPLRRCCPVYVYWCCGGAACTFGCSRSFTHCHVLSCYGAFRVAPRLKRRGEAGNCERGAGVTPLKELFLGTPNRNNLAAWCRNRTTPLHHEVQMINEVISGGEATRATKAVSVN